MVLELYNEARQLALDIEEAAKRIKEELKKGGAVGEKLPPDWETKDIPF